MSDLRVPWSLVLPVGAILLSLGGLIYQVREQSQSIEKLTAKVAAQELAIQELTVTLRVKEILR